MNALHQTLHWSGKGKSTLKSMPVMKNVAVGDDRDVTNFVLASKGSNKRRVQIPLPKSFDSRMLSLQSRFNLESNAAVIQTAIGLLYHFVQIADEKADICIEGKEGKRPISVFALMGLLADNQLELDAVTKYQIMLDSRQDQILASITSQLEASSVAEVVRFALRILEGIGKSMAKNESLIATRSNGIEMELEIQ